MTGARRSFSDAELQDALVDLGRAIAWPPARDLTAAVTARIEAGEATAARPGRLTMWREGLTAWIGGRPIRRAFVLAIAILLIIATVAAALGIGVPGIRILFVTGPTPGPSASGPGASSPAAASPSGSVPSLPAPTPPGFDLGRPVGLDEARTSAGFGVLVPSVPPFDTPAQVWLASAPPLARVSLSYSVPGSSGPSGTTGEALLTEFVGSVNPDGFQKVVGPDTTVEPLSLGGAPAYWISGASHELVVLYQTADGSTRYEQTRVLGNVLLWQVGRVTLRLETTLDRSDALRVAQSVH